MACCFNCKKDDVELYLAPSDAVSPWICRACAIDLGLLCIDHDQIHASFDAGGHACLPCIENAVKNMSPDEMAMIAAAIRNSAAEHELEALDEWIAAAQTITGDPLDAITLTRAVMTYAARRGVKYSDVLDEVATKKSVKDLLPSHFYL